MKSAKCLWENVEIVNFLGNVQYYESAYELPDGRVVCIRECPTDGRKIITID